LGVVDELGRGLPGVVSGFRTWLTESAANDLKTELNILATSLARAIDTPHT
jgi:hypothetical protein